MKPTKLRISHLYLSIGIILLTVLPCMLSAATQTVKLFTGKVILDIENSNNELERIARELLVEGREGTDIDATLSLLNQSKRFASVSTSSTGEQIIIKLIPNFLIKNVRISGNYPILESKIFNVMTIHTGDFFRQENIEMQKEIIREFLKTESFPAAEVALKATFNGDFYDIDYTIDPGNFIDTGEMIWSGNNNFSSLRLMSKTTTWRTSLFYGSSSRYLENTLSQDIKKLLEFYRSKGFYEAELDYTVSIDSSNYEATINIAITEGPLYDIEFQGNDYFYDFTLAKELTLENRGNIGNAGLTISKNNIIKKYKEKGFRDVEVLTDITTENGIKNVIFKINENKQYFVGNVTLHNNTTISSEEIKKNILSTPPTFFGTGAYADRVKADDLNAAMNLYINRGFRYVEVKDSMVITGEEKNIVNIDFYITENKATLVKHIDIKGISAEERRELDKILKNKSGTVFVSYQLYKDINRIKSYISEKGYPHVVVDNEVSGSDSISINYTVSRGPKTFQGKVFLSGNFKTDQQLLMDKIDFSEDSVFSLKNLLLSQKELRNMNVFKSVKFTGLGLREKRDRITLVAELEEKKPYYYALSSGYESFNGFYGNMELGDRNILGYNKSLVLTAGLAETGYNGDLTLSGQEMFGIKVNSTLKAYYDKKREFNLDYSLTKFGLTGGVSRSLSRKLKTGINLNFENRTRKNGETDERVFVMLTPYATYDARDYYLKPESGFFSGIAVDFSQGLTKKSDNFIRYSGFFRYYYKLFNRTVIAFLAKNGYIMKLDTDQVAEDRIFYLGGTSSIRGFGENMLYFDGEDDAVGGLDYYNFAVEMRYEFIQNFEFDLFFDGGNIDRFFSTAIQPGLRTAVGAGLRYITPIGPIGIMYGYKLDKEESEDAGRFHFSIGYTF